MRGKTVVSHGVIARGVFSPKSTFDRRMTFVGFERARSAACDAELLKRVREFSEARGVTTDDAGFVSVNTTHILVHVDEGNVAALLEYRNSLIEGVRVFEVGWFIGTMATMATLLKHATREFQAAGAQQVRVRVACASLRGDFMVVNTDAVATINVCQVFEFAVDSIEHVGADLDLVMELSM
jgi:hypothetical protein